MAYKVRCMHCGGQQGHCERVPGGLRKAVIGHSRDDVSGIVKVGDLTFASHAGLRRPQMQKPRWCVERKFQREEHVSTRPEMHWLDKHSRGRRKM